MKKTEKKEPRTTPRRGNWRCPVCKGKPKEPVVVTAGAKYLLAGKELAIMPHESKKVCKAHVRQLHVQSAQAEA